MDGTKRKRWTWDADEDLQSWMSCEQLGAVFVSNCGVFDGPYAWAPIAKASKQVDGTVLGLDVLSLPEGWTPLEAISVIKALDEEGRVSLLMRTTDGLNSWESLGMLDAAAAVTREGLVAVFEDEPDDHENDDE